MCCIHTHSHPPTPCRYRPLDSQLRPQRRLSALLEYICYQDSAEVQVEAIRIAAELVQVRGEEWVRVF